MGDLQDFPAQKFNRVPLRRRIILLNTTPLVVPLGGVLELNDHHPRATRKYYGRKGQTNDGPTAQLDFIPSKNTKKRAEKIPLIPEPEPRHTGVQGSRELSSCRVRPTRLVPANAEGDENLQDFSCPDGDTSWEGASPTSVSSFRFISLLFSLR